MLQLSLFRNEPHVIAAGVRTSSGFEILSNARLSALHQVSEGSQVGMALGVLLSDFLLTFESLRPKVQCLCMNSSRDFKSCCVLVSPNRMQKCHVTLENDMENTGCEAAYPSLTQPKQGSPKIVSCLSRICRNERD